MALAEQRQLQQIFPLPALGKEGIEGGRKGEREGGRDRGRVS